MLIVTRSCGQFRNSAREVCCEKNLHLPCVPKLSSQNERALCGPSRRLALACKDGRDCTDGVLLVYAPDRLQACA